MASPNRVCIQCKEVDLLCYMRPVKGSRRHICAWCLVKNEMALGIERSAGETARLFLTAEVKEL